MVGTWATDHFLHIIAIATHIPWILPSKNVDTWEYNLITVFFTFLIGICKYQYDTD